MKHIIVTLALISRVFCIPSPSNDEGEDLGENIHLVEENPPEFVDCPSGNKAHFKLPGISEEEKKYITKRRVIAREALLQYLTRTTKIIPKDQLSKFIGTDLENFVVNENPVIALSFAGRGYKALYTGMGQYQGLHGESKNSLRGILDASTYISGSDAGAWLVGSLMAKQFPLVDEVIKQPMELILENGLVAPYTDLVVVHDYWDTLSLKIHKKKSAGFNVTPVDILGNILSLEFVSDMDLYTSLLDFRLSDVPYLHAFKNAEMPYPFLLTHLRHPENVLNKNSLYYELDFELEMSPYTIGSWDPLVSNFINTAYFGSHFESGKEVCVNNFDNLGFLMAMCSYNFIPGISELYNSQVNSRKNVVAYTDRVEKTLFDQEIEYKELNYIINASALISNSDSHKYGLYLPFVQDNRFFVPISPFNEPEREVDILFIFDNIAEEDKEVDPPHESPFSSGRSLRDTIAKAQAISKPNLIPTLPKNYIFHNDTYLPRPAFFGCNVTDTPLVVYIPNGVYSDNLKFPYMPDEDDTTISISKAKELFENGRLSASLDYGEFHDGHWATCISCAIIHHSLLKNTDSIQLPKICEDCFNRYCKY